MSSRSPNSFCKVYLEARNCHPNQSVLGEEHQPITYHLMIKLGKWKCPWNLHPLHYAKIWKWTIPLTSHQFLLCHLDPLHTVMKSSCSTLSRTSLDLLLPRVSCCINLESQVLLSMRLLRHSNLGQPLLELIRRRALWHHRWIRD